MISLAGKTALITGAASGIGLAIAQAFADAGARVWLTDINAGAGAREAAALRAGGASAEFLPLDVSDEAACQAIARRVLAAAPLDILVNNAGIGGVGTLLQTSPEQFDRILQVNVRGVFNVTRAFLPALLERGSASLINLASVGGVVGIPERLAYCTSKFAVVGFTKSLALDHAREGLRANAICPGRVETPFVRQRIAEYPDPEKAWRELSATQPMGRMAKPEEVAGAALFLASDLSRFVTGDCLMVDGGWGAG
jgi:NAD(P)-dependent dehydrogenase (short-subunit alcohol dehydrogenase family)